MKQQHSYHRLFFHLVFSTKNREHSIHSPADGETIAGGGYPLQSSDHYMLWSPSSLATISA